MMPIKCKVCGSEHDIHEPPIQASDNVPFMQDGEEMIHVRNIYFCETHHKEFIEKYYND